MSESTTLVSGGNISPSAMGRLSVQPYQAKLRRTLIGTAAGFMLLGIAALLLAWLNGYLAGLHVVTTPTSASIYYNRTLSFWLIIGSGVTFTFGCMTVLSYLPGFVFKKVNPLQLAHWLLAPSVLIGSVFMGLITLHAGHQSLVLDDVAAHHLQLTDINKYQLGNNANNDPVTSKVFTARTTTGGTVKLQVVNRDTDKGYLVQYAIVK